MCAAQLGQQLSFAGPTAKRQGCTDASPERCPPAPRRLQRRKYAAPFVGSSEQARTALKISRGGRERRSRWRQVDAREMATRWRGPALVCGVH